MEEYDYKIVTGKFKCNICEKVKLCLQCNECFVTTCSSCINILKCNNCNNLFMQYELELIGYKNYEKNIFDINCRIRKHLKLYYCATNKYFRWIDIKLQKINIEIKTNIRELIRIVYNDLRANKDKKLIKLFMCIHDVQFDKYNNKYIDLENKDYDLIDKINRLICTYKIYSACKTVASRVIYITFNDNIEDMINEFVSSRDCIIVYKEDIRLLIDQVRECYYDCGISGDKHIGCGEICKYYLKYYEDIKDKILCTNCGTYNFKYEDCPQIYCKKCRKLYDIISGKFESFIINPIAIYYLGSGDYIEVTIKNYKCLQYKNSLPLHLFEEFKSRKVGKKAIALGDTSKLMKIKPNLINKDSNWYKIFGELTKSI